MSERVRCKYYIEEEEFWCWRAENGLKTDEVGCLVCITKYFAEISLAWIKYAMFVGAREETTSLMNDFRDTVTLSRAVVDILKTLDPKAVEVLKTKIREKKAEIEKQMKVMRRIAEGGGLPT